MPFTALRAVTHITIVSLLCVMENGALAEIAVVGYEVIVGISLFMGGESTLSRAVVQSAVGPRPQQEPFTADTLNGRVAGPWELQEITEESP